MQDQWLAITSVTQSVTLVGLNFANKPAQVLYRANWTVNNEDRPMAYQSLFNSLVTFLQDSNYTKVVVKASSPSPKATVNHFLSAEVRGVTIAAAAQSGIETIIQDMAELSRQFGERKAKGYIGDAKFWSENLDTTIPKTYQETALLLLYTRKRLNP